MRRFQVLVSILITFTWFAIPAPTPVQADSLRCPGAGIQAEQATPAPATNPEIDEIASLWADVGDPTAGGSGGPLGCPVGKVIEQHNQARLFVAQRFQRGWILLERGGAASRLRTVAVRSMGSWWVWWAGPTSGWTSVDQFAPSGGSDTANKGVPAGSTTWFRGGFVALAPGSRTIRIWHCQLQPCDNGGAPPGVPSPAWQALSPEIKLEPRETGPFDFSATLDRSHLIQPDPGNFNTGFPGDRASAAFPAWFPCFVIPPTALGENEVSRLLLMMRRSTPCPVSGAIPRQQADAWLGTVGVGNLLPGTTSESNPCKREGELDVALAGLLHLAFRDRAVLSPTTWSHLVNQVFKPWGGLPRSDPYVQPDGSCLLVGVLESENHILMQETDRFLINVLVSETDSGTTYDNSNNGVRDWILHFLQLAVRRDFYEFNSIPYAKYQLKALYLLHDYAPDQATTDAASGVLDWLYAKEATAANMLRDIRPFRRRPDAENFNGRDWFGSSTSAIAAEAALLVGGGLQNLHPDFDLTDDAADTSGAGGGSVIADVQGYPALATASEGVFPEFTDVMDTTYRLPPQLAAWYTSRFDNAANLETYLQVVHHREDEGKPLDPSRFLQSNDGVEIYSGNRNWTMSAGGIDVDASDPGAPLTAAAIGAAGGAAAGFVLGGPIGAVAGGIIGGLFGGTAANAIQHSALWDTQGPVMRETSFVPTSAGLDRTQTLRFGFPHPAKEGTHIQGRTCVAEGFMCGFDIRMPSHPFPGSTCLQQVSGLPTVVDTFYQDHIRELGCLVLPPLPYRDWSIWTFEGGQIVVNATDSPANPRWEYAFVAEPDTPGKRSVEVGWHLNAAHDWYNIHALNGDGKEAALAGSGDPSNTNTFADGTASFYLGAPGEEVADAQWEVTVEGCDPTYFIVRTGHECHSDLLPRLAVNLTPRPTQSFSCSARAEPETGSFGMEIGGSCAKSPYGVYVYVYARGCSFADECPGNAQSWGFVIAAPSAGWTYDEFASQVTRHILANGTYSAIGDQQVFVPIDRTTDHTVGFRLRTPGVRDWAITSDTGPAGQMISALGSKIDSWPLAASSTSAAGVSSGPFVDAHTNDGCFTVTAPATVADPRTLVVDLRNATIPSLTQIDAARESLACR